MASKNKAVRIASGRAYYQKNREARIRLSTDISLRKLYGLSLEDYERMLGEQGGGCAICGRPPRKRRLAVDHDHQTGRIRGLLCYVCNTLLLGIMERFKIPIEKISTYLVRETKYGYVENPRKDTRNPDHGHYEGHVGKGSK